MKRHVQRYAMVLLAVLLSGCQMLPANLQRLVPSERLNVQLRGLRWLQTKQNPDGSWGQNPTNQPALTGLAVLAFLANGDTPASTEFGAPVEKGIKKLMNYEDLVRSKKLHTVVENKYVSSRDIMTWAMVESYGLTKIPVLKDYSTDMVRRLVQSGTTSRSIWRSEALYAAYRVRLPAGMSRLQFLRLIGGDRGEDRTTDLLSTATLINDLQVSSTNKAERAHCSELAANLSRSASCSWQRHSEECPLLTWYVCNNVFYHDGGGTYRRWARQYFAEFQKHQIIQGRVKERQEGHWQVPTTKSGKGEMEEDMWGDEDSRIYATAVFLMSIPPMSTMPSFLPKDGSLPE